MGEWGQDTPGQDRGANPSQYPVRKLSCYLMSILQCPQMPHILAPHPFLGLTLKGVLQQMPVPWDLHHAWLVTSPGLCGVGFCSCSLTPKLCKTYVILQLKAWHWPWVHVSLLGESPYRMESSLDFQCSLSRTEPALPLLILVWNYQSLLRKQNRALLPFPTFL